jgi:hypothetical protein
MDRDINKSFTGDINIFFKCKNYLLDKGFNVADAIHIGDNKYEFKELPSDKLGCHDLHTILVWVGGDEVQYKAKKTGWYCLD